MIIKGKNVIGLQVVTVDTGTVVETVDDLAYNPHTHRVEALIVKRGGLFSQPKAIHMDDVHNIGENAVIISDGSVIKPVKQIDENVNAIANSKKYLVKTNVLTIDGKELGRITDVFIDSSTGIVETLEVSQGGLKTMTEGKKSIRPADIVTIGADATIVSAYTEAKLEQQGENNGLKGALNDTKDRANELAATVKDAADDAADSMRESSKEFSKNVRRTSKNASRTIGAKAKNTKEYLDKKSVEAQIKAEEVGDDIKEGARDVKNQYDSEVNTLRRNGNKVVKQTKEKFEDATKEVEIESTKVVRKK